VDLMPNLMHFPVEVPTFDQPDPMDPRQSNRKRALRCAVGLVAYWGDDGEGEDAVTVAKDFLTDLYTGATARASTSKSSWRPRARRTRRKGSCDRQGRALSRKLFDDSSALTHDRL
jgi:hypothetical protein